MQEFYEAKEIKGSCSMEVKLGNSNQWSSFGKVQFAFGKEQHLILIGSICWTWIERKGEQVEFRF